MKHNRRRWTVERLAAGCGLERITTRYAFGYMIPMVAMARKFSRLAPLTSVGTALP